eukprot:scaffold3426_cov355-Prasinococcus_capsulatus_cf.AAC.10
MSARGSARGKLTQPLRSSSRPHRPELGASPLQPKHVGRNNVLISPHPLQYPFRRAATIYNNSLLLRTAGAPPICDQSSPCHVLTTTNSPSGAV